MEFDIEKAFVQLRAARKNCVDPDRFFLRREDTALMNRIVVLIREADPEAAEKVHQIVAGPLVPMDQVVEKMTTEVKLGEDAIVHRGVECLKITEHPQKPPIGGDVVGWYGDSVDGVPYWFPELMSPFDALEEACREHGVLG